MIELRRVQKRIINESIEKLLKYGVVYIAAEMRVGKTLASAYIAEYMTPSGECIFVCTPIKVIKDFMEAFQKLGANDKRIVCINAESLHKVVGLNPYFTIIDEAHNYGQIGAMGKRAKQLKEIASRSKYVVLMSGTPTPESEAQIYNQFALTGRGPFAEYKNFYSFAKYYIRPKQKYIGNNKTIIEYTEELTPGAIMDKWRDYKVVAVAEEAGIFTKHNIIIDKVEAPDIVKSVFEQVNKVGVVEMGEDKVLIKSASHRMHAAITTSGGFLYDSDAGKTYLLSDFKIKHILKKYGDKRTAIFYYYVGHEELLRRNNIPIGITGDNRPHIVGLQVLKYSHGVSLKDYKRLVYLQPIYSNKHMIQSMRRADDAENSDADIIFVMSDLGIDEEIYHVVMNKNEKFQLSHFNEWRQRVLNGGEQNYVLKNVKTYYDYPAINNKLNFMFNF